MPNIDFDAARRERLRREDPLTFTLGGESFLCRDAIGLADVWGEPPEPPKDIAEGATTDMARTWMRLAQIITTYIVPEDLDRWWALFSPETDEIIQGKDLLNVVDRLTEEFTGRPTSPSDGSPNGQSGGTTGSTSSSEPDAKD